MGQLMLKALLEGTIEAGGKGECDVENYYAAVVGDNVAANVAGAKQVEEKYPKIFWNGCRSHCGDLLCEDICSITAIAKVVNDAHSVAKFVLRYSNVKAAYQRHMIEQECGNLPKLFPETRFGYADLMLSAFIGGKDEKNINIYQALINDPDWSTKIACSAPANVRQAFMDIVSNANTYKMVRLVRKLTAPLCKAIHVMESPSSQLPF